MDPDSPQPKTLILEKSSKNLKKVLILITLILILGAGAWYLQKYLPEPQKAEPEQISADHPMLFYANLELDPKTNLITQINVGKGTGDLEYYSPTQPTPASQTFIYKVEVVSDKNLLLQSGWNSQPVKLIQTNKGTLQFRVYATYQKDAYVRLYLPDNKLVWTGKMP